jgi:protein-tyrosine phosphatase
MTRLGEVYRAYAAHAARELSIVFGILANGNSLPAMVHCYAGKDRTGIVSALVLCALGVDEEVVIADYAASSLAGERFVALAGAELAVSLTEGGPGNTAKLFDATAENMAGFLDWLCHSYGGPEAYLVSIGVGADELSKMRACLVDPAP